jgi:Do/DeqQ family serine protease
MKWKNFSMLFFAAVLGSILTTGAFYFLGDKHPVKVEHLSSAPVLGASYMVKENGDVVPLEFTDVAKNVTPAVVHIRSTELQRPGRNSPWQKPEPYRSPNEDFFRYFFGPDFKFEEPNSGTPSPRMGTGSGVIINPDGYIVTNHHVIEGAGDIEVSLNDNRVFKARVIGSDPSTDLALLQIKEKGLPYLPLANSDELEVGEWVLAIGNPFNLNSTVTAGIISAKARNINILRDRGAIESFIQTDAAINPGNSGGALVNLQGGLVGINTAIASSTGVFAGYGFAIPAKLVDKVVEDLMEFGMVQRGYLGLMIRSVDGNLANEKDLEVTQGVYVDSITASSAAGEAGVQVGDVILKVNSTKTNTSGELLETIGRKRPGDEVTLNVDRSGKSLEFRVVLRNQEGEEKISARPKASVLEVIGIELEELDDKTAGELDIDGGLKVTRLGPGKLRDHTDMRKGFIITKVDGKEPGSVEDFISHLEKARGGIMLEGVYEDQPGTYYYAFGL